MKRKATPLTEMLFKAFSDRLRSKGRECYEQGRVTLYEVSDDVIDAAVNAYRDYAVWFETIAAPDGSLALGPHCDCPDFKSNGICEHLWAVLLAVDNNQEVSEIEGWADFEPDDESFYSKVPSKKSSLPSKYGRTHGQATKTKTWREILHSIESPHQAHHYYASRSTPTEPERDNDIRYTVLLDDMYYDSRITLLPEYRIRKKNGEWGKWRNMNPGVIEKELTDPCYSIAVQVNGTTNSRYGYYNCADISDRAAMKLFPNLCESKKLYVKKESNTYGPLLWDSCASPWGGILVLEKKEDKYSLKLELRRNDEVKPLSEPLLLTASGWLFWNDRISRIDLAGCSFEWVSSFRSAPELSIPAKDINSLIEDLSNRKSAPPLSLPDELQFAAHHPKPKPILRIGKMHDYFGGVMPMKLCFDYADQIIDSSDNRAAIYDTAGKAVYYRDSSNESQCMDLLTTLGARPASTVFGNSWQYEVKSKDFLNLVGISNEQGWTVEAEGRPFKQPGSFSMKVSTGIDWFDLEVSCDYDGQSISMPELLKALKNKDPWVKLADGSFGILPEEWLTKYGQIATTAKSVEGNTLRFKKNQAFLLDAWLAQQENISIDERFERVRNDIKAFSSVSPAEPPATFNGKLRPYQSDGLGWLLFLRKMGFGGCLADDMGLGKTVQVLALLDHRRTECEDNPKSHLPSIVVVPQSVVFNWIREAATFAPKLKVLNHTGTDRLREPAAFDGCDLVVTTYGILLRDIEWIKDRKFDCAILDESQAIKNFSTHTAKAARLLNADHRLAMSGTPIENHLGELWSLFEYLNPGLLGSSKSFDSKWARNPEPEARATIAQAVRPFILRRTKAQVADDLPDRQEEILYCDLLPKQRDAYNQLREHYRASLLDTVKKQGLGKSKIVILEALLRLRQAACHPGLVKKTAKNTCAKFDTLLPQIEEVVEEGHKVLIFSQFTSFLSLLKPHLKRRHLVFEYLDGQTRNRQQCVDRFQNDPECPLFLISLKAGGLGLNLTAAEYVYILDPWWNPAAEAQAIDRAHRIGQVNKVFAYRMIAQDTVEEKILELQEQKRQLARDIISDDNAILRGITRNDIEFIFS